MRRFDALSQFFRARRAITPIVASRSHLGMAAHSGPSLRISDSVSAFHAAAQQQKAALS